MERSGSITWHSWKNSPDHSPALAGASASRARSLEWQRAVVDIPAQNAVAENQLFRARVALETTRALFTPLSESLHTGNLARNALYDSDGLEITKKFLTKYIGELSAERTRRRKAQGLGGGLLKNVDSNLILLRHSDACDPDC